MSHTYRPKRDNRNKNSHHDIGYDDDRDIGYEHNRRKLYGEHQAYFDKE